MMCLFKLASLTLLAYIVTSKADLYRVFQLVFFFNEELRTSIWLIMKTSSNGNISALLAICAGNSPVTGEFPHKSQWRGPLMFSLICVWIDGWVNNGETGDLRRYRAHYDVIVMFHCLLHYWPVVPGIQWQTEFPTRRYEKRLRHRVLSLLDCTYLILVISGNIRLLPWNPKLLIRRLASNDEAGNRNLYGNYFSLLHT